jgi:hypothetical protein
MNRLVGFIIRVLREDPLSTGMFDVFFKKIIIIRLLVDRLPLDKKTTAPLCRWTVVSIIITLTLNYNGVIKLNPSIDLLLLSEYKYKHVIAIVQVQY